MDLMTAATTMIVDALAVEVVEAMRADGIEPVLLKGASLQSALYPGSVRPYRDVDLLVPDRERANAVLRRLGFQPKSFPPGAHGQEWIRGTDPRVDLHDRIEGIADTWAALEHHRTELDLDGTPVTVLDRTALALHVPLHAAQHGAHNPRTLSEVGLAVEHFDTRTWEAATTVARSAGALDAFATGLRLHPDGAMLADTLGLPAPSSREQAIRNAGGHSGASSIAMVLAATGIRERLKMIAWLIVPPPDIMRDFYPGYPLAIAYLARPFRIALGTPAGIARWIRG